MKRRIAIIMLLLACGAIVNIAVAWLASMLQSNLGLRSPVVAYTASEDPSWRIERVRGTAFDRLVWNVSMFRESPGINLDVLLEAIPKPSVSSIVPYAHTYRRTT